MCVSIQNNNSKQLGRKKRGGEWGKRGEDINKDDDRYWECRLACSSLLTLFNESIQFACLSKSRA